MVADERPGLRRWLDDHYGRKGDALCALGAGEKVIRPVSKHVFKRSPW